MKNVAIQALILAAGRGSRMLELTHDKPKCMVMLAGKTLIDWQIYSLKNAGIKDIFIVGGYLAEVLMQKGYTCFFNSKWNRTNMVESMCCAQEILSQQKTVISYADIIYSSEIVKILLKSSGEIAITYDLLWQNLWGERFKNPLEDIETFRIQGDKVVEIGKQAIHLDQVQGQYMGLMKLTPNGWAKIQEQLNSIHPQKREKIDMTSLLQYLIDSGTDVHGIPITGNWCEVDRPEDLELYERKEGTKWTHDWRS